MTEADAFRSLVDVRLGEVIDAERARAGDRFPMLVPALDEISRLAFAGGKRTRPEFVHLGWVAAGGPPLDPVAVNIGAAFELLHVSALVHDDVIDGALLRRGRPTTHVHVAGLHVREGWAGEERRVSEGAAVLTGNIALALADIVLGTVNDLAREEWNRVRLEVNAGQYLDLIGAAMRVDGEDHALAVAYLKTAKYTVERPLRMGAAAVGSAEQHVMTTLTEYGTMLGVAFQLRDDVLGVFGDESQTGKPVGDDLREGKATLLMSRARRMSNEHDRGLLAVVGDPGLADAQIAELQGIIRSCGALQSVENEIAGYTEKALRLVENSGVRGAADLVEIAGRLVRRAS